MSRVIETSSNYVIQPAAKTLCPDCGAHANLLCHEKQYPWFPSFWICFTCRKVYEVGKGVVLDG